MRVRVALPKTEGLGADELLESLGRHGLGTLEGKAESAVPAEGGKNAWILEKREQEVNMELETAKQGDENWARDQRLNSVSRAVLIRHQIE